MNVKRIAIAIGFSVFVIGCQSKKIDDTKTPLVEIKTIMIQDSIPYTIAQNYFVKNTVEAIENPKIETEAAFNSYFGLATTMGNNGKPTVVDFTKEFAIAIVLPKTDNATTIQPVALKKDANHSLVFEYKVAVGDKQSYTSRPFLLVLVDKKMDGELSLKRIE
jgi:hypothetical protein